MQAYVFSLGKYLYIKTKVMEPSYIPSIDSSNLTGATVNGTIFLLYTIYRSPKAVQSL